MKVLVKWKDGLDSVMDIPDHMEGALEFKTGRPEKVQNAIVKLNQYSDSKIPVYEEKEMFEELSTD